MRYVLFKESSFYLLKIFVLVSLILVFAMFTRQIARQVRFLDVKSIDVLGNNIVDTSTIIILSGITRDKNIIKIDVEKSKRMIETHPFIRAVGLTLKDLDFTITVDERQPFVFLSYNNALLVLDSDGVILQKKSMLTDYDLPVLTGVDIEEIPEEGDRLNDKGVERGLYWFKAIPLELWSQISEINIENPAKIIIYTLDGLKIFLTKGSGISEKFEILYNKLLELKEKKYSIEYIDLRSSNGDIIIKELSN
ncbi:MAG: hypothetical protein C0601_03295 [Candidatus Muiribacterium halophilum]|uniref:POTRA domain-containing protein n=1 Tax=Muiribacterium halophilum TaxID=2053465 RepID=A0A2N5ZJT4_MUIH1|nr:MAG: hypothetical protein C0601_03295 [Candidatus Muirbacterium halophilum]